MTVTLEGTADEFQKVLGPTGLTQPANTDKRTLVVRIPEADYPAMTQFVQQLLAQADAKVPAKTTPAPAKPRGSKP